MTFIKGDLKLDFISILVKLQKMIMLHFLKFKSQLSLIHIFQFNFSNIDLVNYISHNYQSDNFNSNNFYGRMLKTQHY